MYFITVEVLVLYLPSDLLSASREAVDTDVTHGRDDEGCADESAYRNLFWRLWLNSSLH